MSETKKEIKLENIERFIVVFVLCSFLIFLFLGFVFAADPVNPDDFTSIANSSKGSPTAKIWNISGGNISTFNLSATVQNTRWKAFVGNMTGSFTLDDASGSTIFDWTLSTITGRIYATRNSGSINWSGITCSNTTLMEQENGWLSHTSIIDNITATFDESDHDTLNVGPVTLQSDTCPTLSTYVDNSSQEQGADVFEEMVIIDNTNKTVYATILEADEGGYDGELYDFQMLVPENGSAAWTSSIGYYIYVELG